MTELNQSSILSDIGSWASIVGFFITVITAVMLFGLKDKILFNSNIDEHRAKVVEISSEISSLLQSFTEHQKDLEELFALADVELRAMQRGAKGDLLSDIKKSRRTIKRYTSRLWFWVKKDESSARAIKTTLSVVSAELYHHRKSIITGK